MQPFLQSFYTWLIAVLFFPFLLAVSFYTVAGLQGGIAWEESGIVFLLFVFALVLTLPSLLIIWVMLPAVRKSAYAPFEKFLLWAGACIISGVLNCMTLFLLAGGDIQEELAEIIIPAFLSVILSLMIRSRFLLNYFSSTDKMHKHETDMV